MDQSEAGRGDPGSQEEGDYLEEEVEDIPRVQVITTPKEATKGGNQEKAGIPGEEHKEGTGEDAPTVLREVTVIVVEGEETGGNAIERKTL